MYFSETLRQSIVKDIEKKINTMRANGSNCADLYKQLKRWQHDTSATGNTISTIRN